MPFINDVLTENKQKIDDQATEKKIQVSRFQFVPQSIIQNLKKHIIAQNEAIDSIEDTLYRIKAEINEKNKPLSVMFLLGPTGVGKTETVKLLAKSLSGNDNNLCRIDMNTLSQSHYAASLSGAPPGYSGSKENQTLYDQDIIRGSFSKPSVVLFDEIEKASDEVIRSLLGVLDNGKLTLTSGTKTLDFSNSIIFFTSNLGSTSLLKKRLFQQPNATSLRKKAFKSLEQFFAPEFLNRIEQFVYFKPLEPHCLDQLIDIEIENLNKRTKLTNAIFTFSTSTRNELKSAYQREYGARNIHHRIRRNIEPIIARLIVNTALNDSEYCIDYRQKKFIIEKK